MGSFKISGENQHLHPAPPSWQKLQGSCSIDWEFQQGVMGEISYISTYGPE
jgi:hypothetical protein